ncbi:MAG: hypothetical protein WCA46_06250 [Actinocatenispora sp.]
MLVGAVVVGVLLLAVAATVPVWQVRARRRAFEGAQAAARSAVDRLGFCVETVDPAGDAVAASLLADAEERWHTAGSVLADARYPGECAVAERVAGEGLAHVAAACDRLGVAAPR